MPCHSTKPRKVSWFEMMHGISMSSSFDCQRAKRSYRQCSCLLTMITTRFLTAESLIFQSISSASAIGRKRSRNSARWKGSESALMSMRMKYWLCPLLSSEW